MSNITGSFSAYVKAETTFFPEDQVNHQLQLAEIRAIQKSPNPDWNNSRLTYHGLADLVAGNGTQRGYFSNEHSDGDRDSGTFEGTVTVAGSEAKLEGTFTFISGTGKYNGIKGGGNYTGRMVSPTEVQMNWTGSYEVGAVTSRVA